ncbi:M50 family metallopeptidase [Fluviibacterium sp. S390]|uniref:M50 family metallopeptidase n=1 Tax=Fluviibacterium sp. S390 TaxID=3415139 RepID=UPI003C7C7F77
MLAAMLTIAVMFAAHMISPEGARFMSQMLYVWAHEIAHVGTALLGGGAGSHIVINADGSGHAVTSVVSPLHGVLVHAAGPILPAWLAAFALYTGVTRKGNTGLLVMQAAGLAGIAHFQAFDEQVRLALYVWAAATFALGISPAPGALKAIGVLVISFTLTLGVVSSIDYLYVDFIDADPTRPSDAQAIKEILGADDLSAVANTLIVPMAVGYGLAAIFATNWMRRHTPLTSKR